MADNVTITSGANSTPPAGTVVAADEVTINATAVKVQRVKIGTGADGTYDGDVSDSNPLPIDDAGGSLTVDATNLDIRDLTSASDSVAAVQSGTWNVTNVSGTVSLPTGASTAARQDAGNTSLSSIDGKLPALVSSRVPVDGSGVTQPVSAAALPLPSGAATSANQDTLNTRAGDLTEIAPATDTASSGLNGRLQRIAQRITSLIALFPTSLGQKAKAASLAVTLASDQDALPITDNSGSLTVDNAGTFAVQVSSAIPAGTNNIGDVDIASIAAGDNNIGNVDVVTLPALPTGTNTIGSVKITDGTLTASMRDTGSSDSLNVAIVDASGNQVTSFGGGTQFAEDSIHNSGDIGTQALAVRKDTASAVAADGDYIPLIVDSSGRLWVSAVQSGTWTVQPGNTANTTPWLVSPVSNTIDVTVTRPADTTAYAANDELADSTSAPTVMTITSAARASGGTVRLVSASCIGSANQSTKPQLLVFLFDTTTTPDNDNVAFTPTDSELNTCVGVLPFNIWYPGDDTSGATGNTFSPYLGPELRMKTSGSANLFMRIKVLNAYTPVSAEVFKFRLTFVQD